MKYLVDAELDMENRKTFPIIEQCLYTSKKIQMQWCSTSLKNSKWPNRQNINSILFMIVVVVKQTNIIMVSMTNISEVFL